MAFDLATAKPIKSGFDLSSARPAAPVQSQPMQVSDPTAGELELRPFGIGTGVMMPQGVSRFLTGVGKGMTDIAQGSGQLVGLTSQEDIQRKQAIDAPIMATGAGQAGNIAGQVATALPTMFIPGANTVAGASLIGAGTGLVQPVAEGNVIGGKLEQAGYGAIAGAAGQKAGELLGVGAQKLFSGATTKAATKQAAGSVKDATLREAQSAGYVVPPAATKGNAMGKVLSGISGKAKTEQLARVKNQQITDSLAKRSIGLTDDIPLTPDVTAQVRNQAYQTGYEPVKQAGKMRTTPAFQTKLNEIRTKFAGQSSSFPGTVRQDILDMVDSLDRKIFDAGDAVEQIKLLRMNAKDAFSGAKPDNRMGLAYREAADALEKQIEAGIRKSGNPNASQILKDFRDARKLIAKTHTIEDAIVEGSGSVDAARIGRMYERGAPLDSELKTIGAFANNFKESARLPSSADANAITVLDATTMTAGLGLTNMTGGAGAPLMLLPAARVAARYGVLSKPGQRMFTQPNYAPNALLTLPNKLTGDYTNALLRTAPYSIYASEQ